MNIFNENSILGKTLNRIGDVVVLNILWLVCSIPIITIGASTTALYYATLKIVKENDTTPVKNFFRSFKQNFKQSSIVWIIALIIGLILFYDISLFYTLDSIIAKPALYVSVLIALIYFAILLYIFPVIASFENTIKNLLKNSVIFAISNFPKTLLMMAISIFPIIITYTDLELLPLYASLWAFVLVATIALCNSYFLYKIFKKYL